MRVYYIAASDYRRGADNATMNLLQRLFKKKGPFVDYQEDASLPYPFESHSDIITVQQNTVAPSYVVVLSDQFPMTKKINLHMLSLKDIDAPLGLDSVFFGLFLNGVRVWPNNGSMSAYDAHIRKFFILDQKFSSGLMEVRATNTLGQDIRVQAYWKGDIL